MSKKSCFGGDFDIEHRQWSQTLLKSERQHFYEIFWSLWRNLSRKKSLVVICRISRLFVNILTANDKYAILNKDNLMQLIHMQLSQEQKSFFRIFFCIFKIYIEFGTFSKKRMCLIVDIFPKLRTPKNVFR